MKNKTVSLKSRQIGLDSNEGRYIQLKTLSIKKGGTES